ncbi:MAG TPA: GNAT family N-acetyltransferase [Candidatus Polarisedimenticolaceae bacterium]
MGDPAALAVLGGADRGGDPRRDRLQVHRLGEVASRIVPIAPEHIDGFRAAVDAVARERKFLALLEAAPPEVTREFVLQNIRLGNPQFVAVIDDEVVGWCDVRIGAWEVFRHSGTLGMGVVAGHRGRGIGAALLHATLEAARSRGLTRIELTVRTDNLPAIRLYENFGFVHEGTFRRHMVVDGEPVDSHAMALLL